jgi:hypothetical protein
MIGIPSCPGCMYSGHPHLEDCPEVHRNKYAAQPDLSAAIERIVRDRMETGYHIGDGILVKTFTEAELRSALQELERVILLREGKTDRTPV